MAKQYDSAAAHNNNRDAFEQLKDESGGRVIPQATELEGAVLGALMLERDAIISVQEYLTADAFYLQEHRIIFEAISELARDLKPVDLLTVTEQLKQRKQLKAVGGATYLASLTQKVGSAAHLEYHAAIIAQKYVQRELIRTSTEITNKSFDESVDVKDLIDFAESEIFKVSESHLKRDVQSAKNVYAKTMAAIEEASKKGGTMNGAQSGFIEIDKVTLGWQPSDLIIIAARPSMGKTAFVLSMARNMALEHNTAVAFFSLEMSSTQLMMRLMVAESELSATEVRSGRLTPEQWIHLEKSTRPLAEAPLYIDDTPALSVYELRSKVRRLKTQYNIGIIVIDYLQLMTASMENKNGNREQEVAQISRSLKSMAKELNVPVIALSQLSRQVEQRAGSKRPQLSDLRESGAIEQDADIVAFIHRPEYYGMTTDESGQSTAGLAEFIIAKHRNGETKTIQLRFRKEQARFTDYDDFSGEKYNDVGSSMNGGFAEAGAADFGSVDSPVYGRPLSSNGNSGDENAPF